jgi:hypothetical protein
MQRLKRLELIRNKIYEHEFNSGMATIVQSSNQKFNIIDVWTHNTTCITIQDGAQILWADEKVP